MLRKLWRNVISDEGQDIAECAWWCGGSTAATKTRDFPRLFFYEASPETGLWDGWVRLPIKLSEEMVS